MAPDKTFLDTETCGLHSMPVLLQYQFNDGPIVLYDIWGEPIGKTLDLIERIVDTEVHGFNLAFDWFQIVKLYSVFKLFGDNDVIPELYIPEIAGFEKYARDGDCLKPRSACDLFLHARKGPYQSTMDRSDLRIRRVPSAIAYAVCDELTKRIPLKDIYFARKKNKKERWVVRDREQADGKIDPDFKDICLKFAPSSALKALAADIFGEEEEITVFSEIEVAPELRPIEKGYAPFYESITDPDDVPFTWPHMIGYHIRHWRYNTKARKYAAKDVEYTKRIWQHFGCPAAGDDDSILACQVAAVRWKGFSVDLQLIRQLRQECLEKAQKAPKDPARVKDYIFPHLDPIGLLATNGSTSKEVLKIIAKGTGIAAERAREVTEARTSHLEMQMYDKIIEAGRLHASFKVTGTLSNRMSGDSDLNPQGIPSADRVRKCFPLKHRKMILCGGDFASFEVVLAAADYKDPRLNEFLKSGKKIHADFGTFLFDMEYDEIRATDGAKGGQRDFYKASKEGFLSTMYGAQAFTLQKKHAVTLEKAEESLEGFFEKYPGIAAAQKRVAVQFTALSQSGGLGSKITYKEPADFVESEAGFRRYFTLENRILRTLYDIATNPPAHWKNFKGRIIRREREQSFEGASKSALYGAAFGIQSGNIRAAINHRIQSYGASICKRLQCTLWEFQPQGIHPWEIIPMQVHDEVLASVTPEVAAVIEPKVNECVDSYKDKVPLLKIEWKNDMETWASKKG